ncbi:MAG: hypothetical protein EXR70_01315 [Deltaproteobacteria bacterium]|nr:hypothetical protein [Deltaproteobacteria bacterium]
MTIFVCILFSAGLASAADVRLRVVRHGKNLAAPQSAEFVTNIIALLRSCSVHSSAYAVRADTWTEALRADSFVHIAFGAPTKIRVKSSNNQTWEETGIQEILLPLPEGQWPGHIFAKSGTVVMSFTKYDPLALNRIAAEPALALLSVEPYAALTKMKEKR